MLEKSSLCIRAQLSLVRKNRNFQIFEWLRKKDTLRLMLFNKLAKK